MGGGKEIGGGEEGRMEEGRRWEEMGGDGRREGDGRRGGWEEMGGDGRRWEGGREGRRWEVSNTLSLSSRQASAHPGFGVKPRGGLQVRSMVQGEPLP